MSTSVEQRRKRDGDVCGRLTARIREDVLSPRWSEGQRFLTIRELAKRYGAAPGTVNKAIASLEREGLLSSEVGRGTFIRRHKGAAAMCIGVVVPSFVSQRQAYLAAAMRGLEEAASREGYSVAVFPQRTEAESLQSSAFINQLVEKRVVSGLILSPAGITREEYEWLIGHGQAVVMRGAYADESVWSIDTYPPESHRDSLDFLMGLGHRRIAQVELVNSILDVDEFGGSGDVGHGWRIPVWRNSRDIAAELGRAGAIDSDPDLVVAVEDDCDGAAGSICALYREMRPTAMLIGDDEVALDVVRRLEDEDVGVPDDVSVMGRGSSVVRSDLTKWEALLEKESGALIRLIKRQLEGDVEGPHCEVVHGRIHRGKTVGVNHGMR